MDSGDANKVMDLVRDSFVSGDLLSIPDDDSGIKVVKAQEFS